jgi:hypothetical protein
MKLNLALITLCSFLIFSCKKDDNTTTPPTPTPAVNNGVICKIDGVSWSGDKSKTFTIDGDTYSGAEISYGDSTLDFFAVSVIGTDTSMITGTIGNVPPSVIGTYNLSFANDGERSMLFIKKFAPVEFSLNVLLAYLGYVGVGTPGTQTGVFKVTKYDAATKKISGEFNFKQVSPPDAQPPLPTITVTEGKFEDLTLKFN